MYSSILLFYTFVPSLICQSPQSVPHNNNAWARKVVVTWTRTHPNAPKPPGFTQTGDIETTKMFYAFVNILQRDMDEQSA